MKEFEVGDKVKITDCNTNKMVGVEGTIVYVSAKDDLFNYLLRISTDDYKDVGWRIAEGYGCADIPYGLVADYEDDDRYTFWWVAPSEIESVEDEGEEMKSFELGETVRHKTTNCTGKIVYIEKNDAVPYLVRFDADSPYGWGMIENRDNVMHLPQSLIDDYIDEEDYKFWWSPAAFLEHVVTADKEEESILSSDEKYHDKHYSACVVEPIIAMQHILTAEQFKGFLMGNAIKYRLRAGYKDDAKADIEKALRYEQWLKEFEEKGVITL